MKHIKTTQPRCNARTLEQRSPPAIALVNPGGNEPQGDAQGVALENRNPAGHAPPGQNQ